MIGLKNEQFLLLWNSFIGTERGKSQLRIANDYYVKFVIEIKAHILRKKLALLTETPIVIIIYSNFSIFHQL